MCACVCVFACVCVRGSVCGGRGVSASVGVCGCAGFARVWATRADVCAGIRSRGGAVGCFRLCPWACDRGEDVRHTAKRLLESSESGLFAEVVHDQHQHFVVSFACVLMCFLLVFFVLFSLLRSLLESSSWCSGRTRISYHLVPFISLSVNVLFGKGHVAV